MKSYQYLVRKPFKYGGQVYKPGDVWEPDGGSFDRQIIDADKWVILAEAEPAPATAPATRKRRTTNGKK